MVQEFKKIGGKVVFENKFSRVIEEEFLTPDGKVAKYYVRDGSFDVVSILARDVEGNFVLAREYRVGPEKILDELPGGIVDLEENHLDAAKRELLEETGYEGEMIFLGETYLSAYSRNKKFCYLALNCRKVEGLNLDEHEFIEVVLKSEEEFLKQVRSGEMTDVECAFWGILKLNELGLLKLKF